MTLISRITERVRRMLYYLSLLLLISLIIMYILNVNYSTRTNRYSSFYVSSNSMYDEIPKGSLIITKYTEPIDLSIGEDIAYVRNRTTKTIITHRIIDKLKTENGYLFETKGIANEEADENLVESDQIIGKVILSIPKVGYFIAFFKENTLFLPVILIITIFYNVIGSEYLWKMRMRKNK